MEIQVKEIDDESCPETIENWDSFGALILFQEIETKFNVKFTPNNLLNIKKKKVARRPISCILFTLVNSRLLCGLSKNVVNYLTHLSILRVIYFF